MPIDADLISTKLSAAEQVIVMDNGCMCCSVVRGRDPALPRCCHATTTTATGREPPHGRGVHARDCVLIAGAVSSRMHSVVISSGLLRPSSQRSKRATTSTAC